MDKLADWKRKTSHVKHEEKAKKTIADTLRLSFEN